MKKLILLIILGFFINQCFSQGYNPFKNLNIDYKKPISKNINFYSTVVSCETRNNFHTIYDRPPIIIFSFGYEKNFNLRMGAGYNDGKFNEAWTFELLFTIPLL